jgi:hypothetical protein
VVADHVAAGQVGVVRDGAEGSVVVVSVAASVVAAVGAVVVAASAAVARLGAGSTYEYR